MADLQSTHFEIMSHPPAKHVTFAYVGRLQSRGRLLKQIATLQKAGVTCDIILGNTITQQPNPDEFGFQIRAFPVDENSGRLASFYNQMRFCQKAGRVIAAGMADTVVCVSLESLMAGVMAKRIRPQLRLVFDNNELQIESFESRVKRAVWRPVHNYAVRRCDIILHAESNRRDYFKLTYPGRNKPQEVIENFPFLATDEPQPKEPDGDVRVIYLGGFGAGRYTFEILEAFASQADNVRLDIVGFGNNDYVAKVQARIAKLGNDRIRILPPVPYLQIGALLAKYHIGLAFYKNTDLNNYYCAPNKVYDYLMNGMPVIANAYPGLLGVIAKNRVGVCIDTVDAASIGSAIHTILENRMWENITPELRRLYCWEQQEAKYLAVFGH
jgi:glycosyltransferase involved in cell wall biosynthesis